jgi:hypothetical protein
MNPDTNPPIQTPKFAAVKATFTNGALRAGMPSDSRSIFGPLGVYRPVVPGEEVDSVPALLETFDVLSFVSASVSLARLSSSWF